MQYHPDRTVILFTFERTNQYVDYEINKYEMWADDQLVPLQKEVMELSREHDALRRQIRKEHNATIKLQLKKEEMQMSRNLNPKRLFDNYCCMIIKL